MRAVWREAVLFCESDVRLVSVRAVASAGANALLRIPLMFFVLFQLGSGNLVALSQPLQGYAERSPSPNRIQRSAVIDDNYMVQDPVGQTPTTSEFVPTVPLRSGANVSPSRVRPFPAETTGGQDEYWVNWKKWEQGVEDYATMFCVGQYCYSGTCIYYTVGRDRSITINNAVSPDPTGYSIAFATSVLRRVQGAPVLEFPAGSRQMFHSTKFYFNGPPGMYNGWRPLRRSGIVEHVFRQW
jgi:hypothetical protein